MGWVKEVKQSSDEIFNEITSRIKEWRGIPDDSSTPYEYFTDYLRDNFNITLKQCDEICQRLKEYYGIDRFYYYD
jgi:hypothetical protein